MPKVIKIRLKQYGDNGRMEDVGEVEFPDDTPPVKSIEWNQNTEIWHRLGKVTVTFCDGEELVNE